MNFLAFEASTRRLSVALWREGEIAERAADVPNGGSERLLPWALELLADGGLALSQLDGVAFGAGPGGFTGLRLACGVAQGLAFGLDLPVVPVSTLEALALGRGDGDVLACLDARMHEVYVGAYRVSGAEVDEVLAPQVGPAATVTLPAGAAWRGVGDGFAAWGEILRSRLAGRLVSQDPVRLPTAREVARLAAPVLARGAGMDAALALPLYVRDKVALTTAERIARGGMK